MKSQTHEQNVSLLGETYKVTFNFYPGSRGSRDSLGGIRGAGPPLEPDDPDEIEIVSIQNIVTGAPLGLDNYDMVAAIEDELWKARK